MRSALPLGRSLFWILGLSFILLLLVTIGQLPPVVASHFDGAGAPNGWSSRRAYGILLGAIGVLLPLGIVMLVNALTQRGPQLLNIPAREYWRRPEHSLEAVRRVRAYMWWLGCIMTGTALAAHGLILKAHGSAPPHLSTAGIMTLLGGLLLAIGFWMVGWYRVLRPPGAGQDG
jgi:uncharacterized membrane protein